MNPAAPWELLGAEPPPWESLAGVLPLEPLPDYQRPVGASMR